MASAAFRLFIPLLAAALLFCGTALAQETGVVDGAERTVSVGYVALEKDSRYRDGNAYAGIVLRTEGRPFPGAEVGLADARSIGRLLGIDFELVKAQGSSAEELAATVGDWVRERDVHFVLADLPAEALLALSDRLADLPVTIFNVSASDDELRGAACRGNVLHVYPSRAMLTDALVQHLVAKKWPRILVLEGDRPAEVAIVEALRRSAAKFGAEIVDVRPFSLTNDPRQRAESNVALVTAEADYDVVFVADSSNEFGRYVPYEVSLPRPVVGSAGLSPVAWHWSWHRHGAPQLQHRFEEIAAPRRMNGAAWAAWAAMKAITQAALRAGEPGYEAMRSFLLSERLNLDGAKGNPMSFRSWNNQLRQPILLATPNAVVARAPLREFLHQTNVLDTLGTDAPETECRLSEAP